MLYDFNVSNTFKPEIYNEPFIFVKPLTFNEDSIVVLLFKFETPLTFNEDNIVVLIKVVNPLILNDVINVALFLTINSLNLKTHLYLLLRL